MGNSIYKLWILFAFLFIANALQGQCVGNSGFAISSPLCVGQSISFIDTTSAAKDSVIFRFSSDGTTVINDTATKTYNSATTDTVWMYRFFSAPACSDTVFQLITITQVNAAFTPSATQNICIGDSVILNATTAAGYSYQWQESGANIGGATDSSLTVKTSGTYRLVVTQNGCADTSNATVVNVFNYPTADFNFSADSACSGSSVSFTNTSTGSSLSYSWTFGDGSTSTSQNPTHVYDTVGTRTIVSYTARLITSTPGGCADTITKTIYVRRRPDPSIDDFNNLPKFVQCNVSSNPFSLQIDNVSTTTGTNSTYTIDWGDGSGTQNFTNTFDTVTHVYATDGQFTMTVTATDSFGCSNSNTYTVFNGGNPAVSIGNTGSTSGCTPYNITFTIDTSATGVGNNASGTTYTLNFNDGSTAPTYTHPPPPAIVKSFLVPSCGTNTPGFPNSFQAELVVTNPCGTNSATIRPIYISTAPVAEIEFDPDDDTVCLNAPFLIRDVSDTGSVSSNSGCNQTPRRLWDISPGSGWTLNGGSFGNASNWNNNPANWGSQTLNVTFTDTGVYEVELIVGNIAQAGLSVCGDDTIRRIVRVISPPTAVFTINGNGESGCLNHIVSVTNSSTGTDLEYVWQVTPNSGYTLLSGTLTSDSPVFEFNTAGYYFLQLLAENRCSADSMVDTILVKDVPLVSLPDIQEYCGAQTIFFDTAGSNPLHQPVYNNRFGDTLSYQWVITGATGYSYTSGDSTVASPTISFSQPGTYVVTVTFTNECGFDTARQIVIIQPFPVAAFSTNDSTQCLNGNNFVFTDGTTVSSGTITNYLWQFGDGDTSSSQSPSHTYAAANTYTVRLIVTTESGCIDTVEHTVYVYPEPNAVFTVNDTTQCLSSNNFVFTNTSNIGSGTISYLWSFSSTANDTSTQTNPTKVYADTGVYTVTLITTSDNGCIDTAVQNVYVYPQPTPAFTINDTTQCLDGNSFAFTNTSSISSGTLSYSWRFGDGTTSTQTNPTKTYSIAGNYTVTLITTSSNGCIDSVKANVYVYPTPSMSFTVNDTDQCLLGNNFIFTNTSSISSGTATYLWQLSSSATDTTSTTSPTRSYGAAGVYPVKLVGTSDQGCIDSVTHNMTVYADPTADFSINDSTQCLNGNSFVFTNNSTAAGTLSSVWDFGDGTTSTQTNPTKTYSAAGTYTVKLVATITTGGCKDSISKTVYVYPSPVPAFNTNSTVQCFPTHSVVLTNNTTISAGTVTYLWKFNAPSNTDTSTQTSPTKVYAADGTYTIRLIATSDQNCIDSVSQTVTINPDVADNTIGSDQGICAGFAPDTLRQTGPNIGGGNGTFTYQWQNSTDSVSWSNIGGATSSSYQPPVLTDTTWYRRIVVSGPCSDTSLPVKITVTPALADNGITANQFLCEGFTPSQFNGTSPTGGIGTFTYRWQVSVDSANWSNIIGATDTFYQSGALTQTTYFRRVVTSGVCDNNSSPVKVYVNPNPDAAFTTASVCFGIDATFTSTSTIGAGSIAQYNWTFGDGNNGTGSSTTHGYATVGNYTIKLVTTSDSGCVDSTTRYINIHPKPTATFTVNDTCVNNGHSFDATASTVATGAITQYNWTFGDATTGLGSTITKTYTSSGNYNPQLIIVTDSGCRDTAVVPVTVYPKPNPSFTVNDIDQCINGNSFAFTNTSTISAGTLTYVWNLGESTTDTSTQTNPSKVYATNGNYAVKLIATSNQGCVDSTTQTMIVYAKPTPAFSINDSDQCLLGNSFTFTNSSTINPLVGLTYAWTLGDGSSSTNTHPTRSYATEGIYTVKVVVTSANSCKDSVEHDVYVRPEPTADFSINDTLQCFGHNVFTFTNNSTISSGSNTYLWKFDLLTTGDTSNLTSPSKTYATDGVYTVRLIATSDYQCKDSIQKQVEVKPDIAGNAVATDQYLCEGETPDTLRQTAGVSGGNSSFTYQWQQSTDSLNWTNIGGATNTVYAPPALTDTTWYRRIVFSGPCSDTSNVIRVAVTPALANNTITASQNICFQQAPNPLSGATPTGGSGSFSYLWQQSTDSVSWVSATGTNTGINYTPPTLTDTVYYRRRVISATCTTYSNIVKIAVKPLPVVDFGATTICFPNTTDFSDSSTASTGNTITNWSWNFGDGTTSTSQNPTKVYGTAGTFSVKLIVTTDFGCQDSLSQNVTVHPKPAAAFTAPDSCLGITTNFVNGSTVSTGSITSHYWDFGDGDTTAVQHPTHQYAAIGTYNVTLIVTTNNGCADTLVDPVTIHPNPVANFSVNDSDQCVNSNNFVFTNLSTVPSSSNTNLWDFGSGLNDTSTKANPSKVYTANGNYTVTLITTTNFGCADTATKPMVVYAKPTPNFSINDTDQCLRGNSFKFTNTSTINPAVGLSYVWTLGQGATSTQTSPTRVYTASGTYNVRLVVTSIHGCLDSVQKTVYVYPDPVANFAIDDTLQCFGANVFSFTNNSTVSSGSNTYFWRFDLFSALDTSTQTHPTKTYTNDGTFTIRLTTTSNHNCRDSIEKQVVVNPDILNNVISASQTLCEGTTPATLSQLSGGVSGGTSSFTYRWQSSTDSASWTNISGATSASYAPPAPSGTTWYRRIVFSGPCADTSSPVRITIIPAIVNNTITADQNICFGQTPNALSGSTPTGGNGTFSYLWQQSNNNSTWVSASGTNNTVNYTPPSLTDTVYYRRRVISATCTTFSAVVKIAVKPLPAVDWGNSTVCEPSATQFADSSTVNQGSISTWAWTFGDGTTSSQQNPLKQYSAAGTYTVKLIATTNFGCQDSLTQSVIVHPKPVASFTSNVTCAGVATNFTNTSTVATGSILSYRWAFGDGDTSVAINPTHSYASGATYNVNLIVVTDNGCRDTVDQSQTIYPNPTVAFNINDSDQCVNGNNFIFTNNSTVSSGSNTFLWNFGSSLNDTSTQNTPPNKVYAFNGTFTVRLTATTNFGCSRSLDKQVVVYAQPVPAYTVNDTDQCINGNSFVFTNNSTVNPFVALSYLWTFGDGTTSTQTSPTKVYSATGTYPVKVRVTSLHGCADSTQANVYVYAKPNPAFTIDDTLQCFGPNIFNFTNNSTISTGSLSYFWRFDLNSVFDTSTQINPTKTYTGDGIFTIRLTATSDNNCKDSIEKQVEVKPDILNNAITASQAICEGQTPDTLRQSGSAVSGGSSAFTYVWQQSADSISWTTISGATSVRYAPPALTDTTWYRRIVYSGPCGDTSTPIRIAVTPAIANNTITASQVICYTQTPAQLNGASPNGGNSTFSYLWQQSNDTTTWVGASNTNTTISYQPPSLTDTVYYRRRVISAACTTFSNIVKVAVKPLPVVAFGNTTECFPNATQFTDSSTVNQGTNTNWNWTFGDGTTSTAQNPSKQYTAGSYTVKLIVTTNFGCQDSVSKGIIVHPNPIVGYTSQDICFGFTSSFTDTSKVSTGSITNRNWDFGDGFTSSALNPNHSYNTHGTFNVRLIVTTDRNCRDTVTRPVVIYPKPQAKFGVPPTCLVDSASFFDSSTVATGNITTWAWTFGDGDTSSVQNPVHPYATDGSYTAKLIVTTDRGCKDSTNNPVIVRPMPVVGFNGDTVECINRNVFYTNTSTGAFTYHWDFGDGDTSNGIVGVNTFNTPGIYRVSLIGRTVYGCIDSFARNIEIVAPPSPTFTLVPDSGCAPLNANFTNNSTGAYTSYQWNFGNGQSSNVYNPPTVTYQQSLVVDTNYVVTLRATNLCGSRFAYDTVKVYPQPVANFGPDATSGCTPKTFTFTNTSAGFPEDYFWDFGNGDTSTLQNPPPQTYTTDTVITVYTIRLRVVNRCGVDTATRTVTVLPKNAKSLFGLDTTIGCVPLTINISDFSQGATLVSYDFGDGNFSSNANPTHTFTDTGVFRIRQFISNTCTYDTSEQFIRVQPGPTVSFTNSPSTKCEGQDVHFLSQTTNVSGFRWEFGTGDTSNLSNPNYAYPSAGAYLVKLTVTSAINACTNSFQDTVRINAAPVPVLNLDTSQGCPPLPVTFSNGSANTVFLQWNFGDGNTSNLVNPTHVYNNTGVYVARLKVRNAQGCEDSIDRTIQVHPSPTADFTQTSTYCNAPVVVDFTNNSTGATGFTWNFGNGVTSSLNNPSVQFNNFGTFTTVLTASNQFGCIDTASRTFEIYRIPTPNFTLDTNRGCPPLTVNFNDNSQLANKYEWDFGDGNTDTSQSPSHTYTTSGTFNVKLKVTSGGTCADSLTLGTAVTVHPVPVAGFTYTFDTNPAGYGIADFTDASQNAATYLWTFGDGNNANIPSPSHRYSYVGNYLVTQYIVTAEGCRDTAYATVDVPIFKGVFVPNAFTPGTGGPDVRIFKPVAISLKNYKFEIYDTWGKLLFSSTAIQDTKPAEGWDGAHEGVPCQQDVYVWKIEAEFLDGSIWPGQKAPNGRYYREGTVTLIR